MSFNLFLSIHLKKRLKKNVVQSISFNPFKKTIEIKCLSIYFFQSISFKFEKKRIEKNVFQSISFNPFKKKIEKKKLFNLFLSIHLKKRLKRNVVQSISFNTFKKKIEKKCRSSISFNTFKKKIVKAGKPAPIFTETRT